MDSIQLLQQQQAMINQVMQHYESLIIIAELISLTLFVGMVWVIYLFYRCQRDAADELRSIRIILQFEAEDRQTAASEAKRPPSRPGENPFATT